MEIPPELKKDIKDTLSLFMDEPEAERFLDLDYATNLIRQREREQPPWQVLVSLGVHIAEIYLCQDGEVRATLLQELVDQALEPVDALFQSILPKPSEELPEGEQARLLFHTRFALGFLLLAQGTKERSRVTLHDMAATKVSMRGYQHYGGYPGILGCTADIRQGKWQTLIHLLPEYVGQERYREVLFLMTEVLACAPWAKFIPSIAPTIIDNCVLECEKTNLDEPDLEWLWLLVEVGELLSLYGEGDSSGAVPNECQEESPQYLSWKVGQIAGRFAARWHDNPFAHFQSFVNTIGEEEFQSERGEEKTQETIMAILALIREYDPAYDWQKMRDQFLSMWALSYRYSGMPLSEIGPCHDLHWAMRIGFVDALLKYPAPLSETDVTQSVIESRMWSDIDDIVARRQEPIQLLPREEVLKLIETEESAVLEFKSSARWDYKQKRLNDSLCLPVIQTVAAFLNGRGGRLLIGVDDDHGICGLSGDYQRFLRGKERDQYLQFIVSKLCDYIGKVEVAQSVSTEFYRIGNEDICLLDVRRSAKPVYVRKGSAEDFYIRVENQTRKLNIREALDYVSRNFPRRFGQT